MKRSLLVWLVAFSLALAALFLPLPKGPVPTIGPLVREEDCNGDRCSRGNVGGFRPEAGAGVQYASVAPTLASLGIGYTERLLAPSEYTPGGINPQAIVVHNTDSPAALGCGPVYNTFAGPTQASTHFCIDGQGTVYQFVPLDSIAWGNGDVQSPDLSIPLLAQVVHDHLWMNQFTWSIELTLDYSPTTEYARDYPKMIDSLAVLVKFLASQAGLPLDHNHILTHHDINSVNRVDPICCWTPGGLAAGAQAFDAWVIGLTPPAILPRPAHVICVLDQCADLQGAIFLRAAGTEPVYWYGADGRLHHVSAAAWARSGEHWDWVGEVHPFILLGIATGSPID